MWDNEYTADCIGKDKFALWNEIVEKVNIRITSRAFVGRRTKCNKASLKNEAGVSVTSMKGKLEAFQKHLHVHFFVGGVSIESDFDSNWKELVERKESICLKYVRMKL